MSTIGNVIYRVCFSQLKTVWMFIAVAAIALLTTSCRQQEIVEEPFEPSTSHADYLRGLVAMNLEETVIGSLWIEQATQALNDPVVVFLPYRETALFEPTHPEATGFRFDALRGQRIEITLEIDNPGKGRMFADVFHVTGTELEAFPQIASYSDELNRLEFEPRRDSTYILRLQPELLHGGSYEIAIFTVPSIGFPVEDHGIKDIKSFFGDSRDSGTRSHEGVDIFAPRGTPVVAVAPGIVRHVGELTRGGLVVSISDEERELIYYYAHLEEQLVIRGERVEPGDIVGTVGNTGNAISTPPHLQFGIYEQRWSAIDPWKFLYRYAEYPSVSMAGRG